MVRFDSVHVRVDNLTGGELAQEWGLLALSSAICSIVGFVQNKKKN